MIKKVLLTAVVCLITSFAFANDYNLQSYQLEVNLGVGISSLMTDINDYGTRLAWGKNPGYMFALQGLAYVEENVAAGFEFGMDYFPNKYYKTYYYGNIPVSTTAYNFFITSKYIIGNSKDTTIYIPVGAGVKSLSYKIYNERISSTAPAVYIGFGIEFPFTIDDDFFNEGATSTIGLEMRLNYSHHKLEDVSANLAYMSFLVKIGGLF